MEKEPKDLEEIMEKVVEKTREKKEDEGKGF